MKPLIFVLFLGVMSAALSGCENLYKDTRQTGKNMNALFFEGYPKDLYESK